MGRRSGSVIARELWVRLLLGSVLLLGLSLASGCGKTELIVDVGNIPAAATELRAIVRSDGKQSRDIPRFGFTEGRSTYAIGLRLHERQSGSVQLTVGAFSKGCLISTAITTIDDLAAPPERVSINLDPPRSEDLMSDCPDEVPQMLRAEAEHDSVTQRNHLVLHGWGFDPGSSAFLGDAVSQAADLSSINPLILRMVLPDLVPPINNQLKNVTSRFSVGAGASIGSWGTRWEKFFPRRGRADQQLSGLPRKESGLILQRRIVGSGFEQKHS